MPWKQTKFTRGADPKALKSKVTKNAARAATAKLAHTKKEQTVSVCSSSYRIYSITLAEIIEGAPIHAAKSAMRSAASTRSLRKVLHSTCIEERRPNMIAEVIMPGVRRATATALLSVKCKPMFSGLLCCVCLSPRAAQARDVPNPCSLIQSLPCPCTLQTSYVMLSCSKHHSKGRSPRYTAHCSAPWQPRAPVHCDWSAGVWLSEAALDGPNTVSVVDVFFFFLVSKQSREAQAVLLVLLKRRHLLGRGRALGWEGTRTGAGRRGCAGAFLVAGSPQRGAAARPGRRGRHGTAARSRQARGRLRRRGRRLLPTARLQALPAERVSAKGCPCSKLCKH